MGLLHLRQQHLARQVLAVRLAEDERLVVQRLGVVLLVHLAPHPVPLPLGTAPLGVLLFQPGQHHRHRAEGLRCQQAKNLLALLRIRALQRALMKHRKGWQLGTAGQLGVSNLPGNRLKVANERRIQLNDQVKFEPVVLAAEEHLLVLVLAGSPKAIVVHARWHGNPIVVEDAGGQLAAGRRDWQRILVGHTAVRRAKATAR
mmetsp:Transcript_11919/g.37912  ORF Transcript_11919/g.37912 Transcript_11919/m.37912 type:complete len:202 (+) Transcript_11919:1926-2531(+)